MVWTPPHGGQVTFKKYPSSSAVHPEMHRAAYIQKCRRGLVRHSNLQRRAVDNRIDAATKSRNEEPLTSSAVLPSCCPAVLPSCCQADVDGRAGRAAKQRRFVILPPTAAVAVAASSRRLPVLWDQASNPRLNQPAVGFASFGRYVFLLRGHAVNDSPAGTRLGRGRRMIAE